MRNLLKALPLGVVLPMILFGAATPPDAVGSNISKWLKLAGASDIPAFLVAKSADHWVAIGAIIVALVYSLIVWRSYVARTAHLLAHRLHLEGGSASVERDTWLQDAIFFAVYGRWIGTNEPGIDTDEKLVRASKTIVAMRELGESGKLIVWGKTEAGRLHDRIDNDFWKDHQVEITSIFDDDPKTARTERTTTGASHKCYKELKVNKAQAEAALAELRRQWNLKSKIAVSKMFGFIRLLYRN